MQPSDLDAHSFAKYAPLAHSVAVEYLGVLRDIPLSVLPVFLTELKSYDESFPAERQNIQRQLKYLTALSPRARIATLAAFAAIRLPQNLEHLDWVDQPEAFTEQWTAALWSTHQMDAYRAAATRYQFAVDAAQPQLAPETPRLAIVIIGRGAKNAPESLFQKLRPHGCLFTAVDPTNGLAQALDRLRRRASKYASPYAHWYIDGGATVPGNDATAGITATSYAAMAPIAEKEMERIHTFVQESAQDKRVNAEDVRSYIRELNAHDLGINRLQPDPALSRFSTDILTRGSGTQIYSTTFVLWSSRECLRRAQPITLLARYAPRQQSASLNDLLARNPLTQPTDPEASLIDANMGAYYTWIDMNRLPGADHTRFLAWFEDHSTAIAISPSLPRNTTSSTAASIGKLLDFVGA